jgi:hypothetical protein
MNIKKHGWKACTALALLAIAMVFVLHNTKVTAVSIDALPGTIDATYHYAWGENIGWVDFSKIQVTDSGLSGSAYGENIGWIDLSTVTNDGKGNLSGYAWGENIGWVDFSKVTIGTTDGVFSGAAYGENIGWILFGATGSNNEVMTNWRPESALPQTVSSTTSGGSITYGCKDPKASNYNPYSASKPSLCQYTTTPTAPTSTTTTQTTVSTTYSFTRTLRLGMTGDDVKALQGYLNTHGYLVSQTGPGSLNNETTYFGPKTKAAVIDFQNKNELEPDGIVGPHTREFIK